MQKFNIKEQVNRLLAVTAVGSFKIAGASWVALLAIRGFSILEIGVLESIFHVVSCVFEIPSGVLADAIGRKKTFVMSHVVAFFACVLMVFSKTYITTAVAIGISALSYNLASGTREAMAYDSLKAAGKVDEYDKFASTEMMLYRVSSATATLLAGAALWLGYKRAYIIDAVVCIFAIVITFGLVEIDFTDDVSENEKQSITERFKSIVSESYVFLRNNRKARWIMILNSFIGAIAVLVLFFLQAKLPLAGLSDVLFGPALFIMGMGAALGSKVVERFTKSRYRNIVLFSCFAVTFALATTFQTNPYVMVVGGFVGAFADDFVEVRTDILLNDMIPSEQRATLISVNSFMFSIIMIVMSTLLGWILN